MKYTNDYTSQNPANENTKIWRYMDFTKFVSLLDKKALFFCRSDKLGDPFEGSTSKANIKLPTPTIRTNLPKGMTLEHLKRFVIINCWSLNEHESAALWKLYLKGGDGVAVQSTFKRLTQSFNPNADDYVFISKIRYIDYKTELLPEQGFLSQFWHKRKSFEHEQELRAIIMKFPRTYVPTAPDIFDGGEYVEVNLEMLIENVYVSPTAQNWFRNIVESIMKKYNIKKSLIRSDLDDTPVF